LATWRLGDGIIGVMVTIADCEHVQTEFFMARAAASNGTVWRDDGLLWIDGPDGLNVMFPGQLSPVAVRRGVDRARALGRDIVGAWLGLDVDPTPLAQAGFTKGWTPSWMTAQLSDVPAPGDQRVRLERVEPARAWYATAHIYETNRFAGHAWSFRHEQLAGVFDMEVWPAFQRMGLGTALLAAVCAAARQAGATDAVLNATPEGELLYRACGFSRVGAGITWWHHMGETQ
jgi:GNAT superfamily N-acetyltransferase